MQPLSAEELAAAVGGTIVQHGGADRILGVSTDSRTLQPGELFVPIIGERFDAHRFIGEAVRKGAPAVLVDRSHLGAIELLEGVTAVAVDDTLSALEALASWDRKHFCGPVVAVTGSNGKTTTKDLLAAVLSEKYRVLATEGNLNTEIGMAMTLLRRTVEHQAIVVEMGMRGAGQIASLARIARPSIGVVTNVGPVHAELLGSIDAVAAAKRELVEALPATGTAVLNADDPRVAAMAAYTQARVVTFGLGEDARVRASDVQSFGLEGLAFRLHCGSEAVPVRLPVPGRHNVANALAAAAVGVECGLSLSEVAQGLAQVRPSGLRMQVERLSGGVTLINDAYNASPASMEAALATLADTAATRRIAVLGDMLELGRYCEEAHQKVGEACGALGLDRLITVGPRAERIAQGALASGMKAGNVTSVSTPAEAAVLLLAELRAGDTVLLKASRGLELERIAEALAHGLPERK